MDAEPKLEQLELSERSPSSVAPEAADRMAQAADGKQRQACRTCAARL